MPSGLGRSGLRDVAGVDLKSLTSLWSCMANELAIRCCTSADRDVTYVTDRSEHEGLSFYAITLASYGKAIERWLERGFVDPSDATEFRFGSRLTGLPPFLGGFLGRVFDSASGVLMEVPSIEAIFALRQLTLFFSKIALPDEPVLHGRVSLKANRKVVDEKRERRAMAEYLQCEQDVREADDRLFPHDWEEFNRIASLLYDELFLKVDSDVALGKLVPKHGPGFTADRLVGNDKWNQRTWPARLRQYFPPEDFLVVNAKPERVKRLHEELIILEPGSEVPVKVTAVPKTLKTPRIIAMEPAAMQYSQQSLFRSFRDHLEEDDLLSKMIGIEDQNPNRVMARVGSREGDLATLDLSEASDRVSMRHVANLLGRHSQLHGAVKACRSAKAAVRGEGIIPLAKFASMGSALCFPVEAMVFLTVIFVGIQKELSTPLTRDTLVRDFLGRVRVFGDDIIVPADYVLSVVHELENFGFRVNVHKSFWTGRFRESCGREFYDGEDVSIVRMRRVLPRQRQDATGVISTVALRNLAYWAGLWQTARWLDTYLGNLLGEFPNVGPDSPVLGRESALGYQFQRLDPNTHSPLVKGYYVRAKSPISHLDGEGALLKCLIGHPDELAPMERDSLRDYLFGVASVDDEHLERSGRPEHVSIKLGWRLPY
uniref:RNA-directed RNA polymerase n=1 Tax=Leviviridae sp. TaxID=2027243 RepID=A0A514D2S5_9VIRU|nr:MAG: RNA-dependent RNA polymerase [Leviviridae sp.]